MDSTEKDLRNQTTKRIKELCNLNHIETEMDATKSSMIKELLQLDSIIGFSADNHNINSPIENHEQENIDFIETKLTCLSNALEDLSNDLIKRNAIKSGYDEKYHIPNEILIYQEFDINLKDEYEIETPFDIGNTPVLLLNKEQKYSGFFTTVKYNSKTLLCCKKEDIKFENLESSYQASLVFFNKKFEKNFLPNGNLFDSDFGAEKINIEICIKKAEQPQKRLCIDFGTSNTSAGTYNEKTKEVEIVNFFNEYDVNMSPIFPTIVYVKDCSDVNHIEYLFGFSAKLKESKENYCLSASIFYEIKRWINDYDKEEEIRDEKGNKQTIKRISIIEAYLKHILNIAEHQFKSKFNKLHFSAPVKLKRKYIDLFTNIFPEHNISKEEACLDEGIAIIYNFVHNEVSNNIIIDEYPKNEPAKIMIIDSGGGTTDLASCAYKIIKKEREMQLNIDTQFEDCDSNFGGNNLTYRILQYIKIKLANHYCPESVRTELSDLLQDKNKILEYIDNTENQYDSNKIYQGLKNVYADFESEYEKAGKIIPTVYIDNPDFKSKNEVRKLKTNYYLLWNLAEIIKKEFFQNNDFLLIGFNEEDKKNSKIKLPKFSSLKLNYQKDNQFYENNDLPDISISIKDITTLIYGDIYYILWKLLGVKNEQDLIKYQYFILSGQTCNITLFDELFKEFVPGRKLRSKTIKSAKEAPQNDPVSLKLLCLKGCIKFCMDKENAEIVSNINVQKTDLKYQVCCTRVNEQKTLLSNKILSLDHFDPDQHDVINLKILDENRQIVNELEYNFSRGYDLSGKETTLEDLIKQFKIYESSEHKLNNLKTELNNINEDRRIICLMENYVNYGFELFEIIQTENNFYIINQKFYNFEKDLSEITFFNGKR